MERGVVEVVAKLLRLARMRESELKSLCGISSMESRLVVLISSLRRGVVEVGVGTDFVRLRSGRRRFMDDAFSTPSFMDRAINLDRNGLENVILLAAC